MYAAEMNQASDAASGSLASGYVHKFFEQEYRLDYTLHTYPKPVLCWAHGIVMGGGLGLLAGCSHRVVTEASHLSMPEIAIGHFPDVGASWFLNRMPDATGLFIALTGAPLDAGDAADAKLADYRIAHGDKSAILTRLVQQEWSTRRDDNDALLGDILRSARRSHPAPRRRLRDHGDVIHAICSRERLSEIHAGIAALATSPDPWLQSGARRMMQGYAGSVGLIHALLRRTAHISLAEVLRLEYRVAIRSVVHGQFLEGIRALIIDKDRAPRWDRTIDTVTPEWVERTFFEPLPAAQDALGDLEHSVAATSAKTWG
jgi:enoyl-CoA hydratase/carnithine racemase